MATSVMIPPRNLPISLVGEAERLGYTLLRGLDRLGFIHETRDGNTFSIRFDAANLYGDAWAAFHVDAERLYHFSVHDLARPNVLAQLSAVARKPVRAVTDPGLVYVVELKPRPGARLPSVAPLDLAARPAGDLMVPLGVGRDGPRWLPLARIGHAMIAGATGSGKSTFVHSALAALLTSSGPDVLRVALVDPKRSELPAWGRVPHLWSDIATTPDQAAGLLNSLVAEVDRRGDLLAAAAVRDFVGYNKRCTADPLPLVLIVIDECLDLADDRSVMEPLKTLAIRGRSAGVFAWCSTQHAASIVGLPRVLNVNLASRLAFRVLDESASRAALQSPGAEKISPANPGRMLAKLDGSPEQIQGFYLSDDDLLAITRGLSDSAPGPTLLSDVERNLLIWAAAENGGALSLADIHAHADLGPRDARRLACKLEARGWLIKDPTADNRRVLTEQGRALAANPDKPTNLTNPTNRPD